MKAVWSKFRSWFGRRSKRGKIVVALLLLFFSCVICRVIGSLFGADEEPAEVVAGETSVPRTSAPAKTKAPSPTPRHTNTTSPTRTPVPTKPPTATPPPEEEIERVVREVLGSGNRDDAYRVKAVTVEETNGTYHVTVEWAINMSLTEDLIRSGARLDVMHVGEALSKGSWPIYALTMRGSFPLVDVYGNSKETEVVKLAYSEETFKKINWTAIDPDNIYMVADSKAIHRVFQ